MSNVMMTLDQAKPVEERHPFFDAGPSGQATHKAVVLDYGTFPSTKNGEAIGANFLIVESASAGGQVLDQATGLPVIDAAGQPMIVPQGTPVHPPGSLAFMGWFINKASRWPDQTLKREISPAIDFVVKLFGIADLAEAKRRAADAFARVAEQPFRGRMITVTCTRRWKTDPQTRKVSTWVERTWKTEALADAQVAQVRASIDASHPYTPRVHQGAPVAQVTQAPMGYGAPAAAAYPQPQPAYPQAAPPPAPPAYGYPAAPAYPQAAPPPAPAYPQAPAPAPAYGVPPGVPGMPAGFPGFPPGNGQPR